MPSREKLSDLIPYVIGGVFLVAIVIWFTQTKLKIVSVEKDKPISGAIVSVDGVDDVCRTPCELDLVYGQRYAITVRAPDGGFYDGQAYRWDYVGVYRDLRVVFFPMNPPAKPKSK
jgi:hypothetical protein